MSNVEVLLTRRQIAERTGLTLQTIKTYRRDGIMPEPDAFYERTPLWRVSTIDTWRKTQQGKDEQ